MVYSLETLGLESDNQLNAQAVSQPVVTIMFDAVNINNIVGPTPFIDLSSNVERNEFGEALVITNRITLNGKINYPDKSGVSSVISGINALQDTFKTHSCGVFSASCGVDTQILATGVRVISVDINKTNDNWIFSADYNVVLEYNEPVKSGWGVRSYSDSWNIEPLEDYVYDFGSFNVRTKQEYHNPNIKPPVGNSTAAQTTSGGNSNISPWGYLSIPRYKISRTISAVGMATGIFCDKSSDIVGLDTNNYTPMTKEAFKSAKAWVEKRSSSPFQGPNSHSLNGAFLFNHLRSTNFDITAAKYEITDTWLSMPFDVAYLEDYTVELSTDDKYVHTVRVQGEINGLSTSKPEITGQPLLSNFDPTINVNLISSMNLNSSPIQNDIQDSPDQKSDIKQLTTSKYTNAINGWIKDIKPYLYRRASIVLSSNDRNTTYVTPNVNPPRPPNNPIYCQHSPLNIIPVSTSESHNPKKGSVSYSYEFNNKSSFNPISGTIFTNISTEEIGATDVIAEAFVLGRALGPVLQNLGTKTSTKKSVTIEVGVVPPSSINGCFLANSSCPVWTGGTVWGTVDTLIKGLKPFGPREASVFGNARIGRQGHVYVTQDNESWDPTNGRYARSVGWTYQQCTNAKPPLDY